jgi:hypothetical protein
MDPTSCWVFVLLCESTGPIHPHCCLPTLLPLIYPHSTRPHLRPPPPQLCLIPPQPPQNHPPLFHGSLGLYRRQLLVPTKVGQCGWLLGWAWKPPTLPSQPTPRKPQTKLERQIFPSSRLPPFTIPPLSCNTIPCHPQRPSPCLLPAHTRGGSVCGRGEYAVNFGGGQVLVELTLTLTNLNLGHPQQFRMCDWSCDFLG